MIPALIVGICWIIFIVVWAVSALSAKRTRQRSHGLWYVRFIVLVILIVLVTRTNLLSPRLLWLPPVGLPLQYLGAALCVLGIALAIWARFYLGRNWGMPQSVKENPELVTTGPYAFIRHPIYTGMLFAMAGSTLAIGLWWLIVLVAGGAYFIVSAHAEERLMQETFPDHYPEYKRRTWALIPFIY